MITLDVVRKSVGPFWMRQQIIDGISAHFERRVNYVILGEAGSGKTTLLNLIAGTSRPSGGRISRSGMVSVPVGAATILFPYKTGRALIGTMSKLYRTDPAQVEHFIVSTFAFQSELLDLPTRTLTGTDRLRLSYAIGYALPCDFLLFDRVVTTGDRAFRDLCDRCFEERRRSVGTLLITDNVRLAKKYGDVAAILHRGKLVPYPSVDEAIAAFGDAGAPDTEDGVEAARRLIAAGQAGEAVAALTALMEAEGSSPAAVEALVEALLRDGRAEEAEQTATGAYREGNASPKLLFILARLAESQGRYGDAIQFCKEGASESEGNREFKFVLARSYEQTGAHAEAGRVYRDVGREVGNPTLMKFAERNFVKAEMWSELLDIAEEELAGNGDESHYRAMKFQALCHLAAHDLAADILRELGAINMEAALAALLRQRRQLTIERFAVFLGGLDAAAVRAQAHSRSHEMILVTLRREINVERRAGRAAIVAYLSVLLSQVSVSGDKMLDVTPVAEE